MTNKKEETNSGIKETSSLETFSDGVFAIAITLLILELIQMLHPEGDEGLLKLLLHHWESLLAFVIGFLTILICWINHHLIFTYIKKTDSNLMWVNGFVLLIVTFTPFPTAILAGYLEKDSHTAAAIFGFNYFMMSIAAYSITAYVYNKRLIEDECRELFYYFKLIYGVGIIYTFLIFFVCFVSVPAAIFFYCLLFVLFAYPKEISTRLLKRKHKRRIH